MTTKTAELGSAQEAFAAALKRSMETVATLRRRRRVSTQELPALDMGRVALVEPSKPPEEEPMPPRERRPSKIRVSVTGSGSDFQSILTLMKGLRRISEMDGEIVCIDENMKFDNGHGISTSAGLQSFWTRAGKEPPPIRYTNESLEQVLEGDPVAVLMAPGQAPDEVSGYIKVVLAEPHVCFLLRRDA